MHRIAYASLPHPDFGSIISDTGPSAWGRAARLRGGHKGRAVELDKFLADRRPELLWEMEKDLFKYGDQRTSAKRMLAHIEKFLGHKNEEQWISEFTSLVKGEPEKETAEEVEAGSEAEEIGDS